MLANVHEERPTPRMRQIGVFRVLTYNVLAEIYATRQMYPYCPVWALSWSYRRELLRRELQSYNADILCLQVWRCYAIVCFLLMALLFKSDPRVLVLFTTIAGR